MTPRLASLWNSLRGSRARIARLLGIGLATALLASVPCPAQDAANTNAPAASESPLSSDSLLTESAQRLADGDYEGAIRDASTAIQLDPKNPAGYEARGTIYIQEKLWDRAERDYQMAAKLSPDVVYKYKLAEIKFLAKAYEDAQPRFAALESDPNLGDLAIFQAFLCDLLGGHEDAAQADLAACDRASDAPSRHFCHAVWYLYHNQRPEAGKYFKEANQLYDSSINDRYFAILLGTQRFQTTSVSFTDRDGTTYPNASVFLEDNGLRVSNGKGWATIPLDKLPDDLSAFPEELREQIDRKRAIQSSAPPATTFLSFTTRSGQKYELVRWSLEDTGLSVLTSNGWLSVPFKEIPDDLSPFPPELQQIIIEKRKTPSSDPVESATISFTTKTGMTYSQVRGTLGWDGVHVMTPGGLSTVLFRDLPDDLSVFPSDWQPEIQKRRASIEILPMEMRVISFTTRRGVHYDQVRAAIEKGGLRLLTSDGLIAVPFNQLPDDLSNFPEAWRATIAEKESVAVKTNPATP